MTKKFIRAAWARAWIAFPGRGPAARPHIWTAARQRVGQVRTACFRRGLHQREAVHELLRAQHTGRSALFGARPLVSVYKHRLGARHIERHFACGGCREYSPFQLNNANGTSVPAHRAPGGHGAGHDRALGAAASPHPALRAARGAVGLRCGGRARPPASHTRSSPQNSPRATTARRRSPATMSESSVPLHTHRAGRVPSTKRTCQRWSRPPRPCGGNSMTSEPSMHWAAEVQREPRPTQQRSDCRVSFSTRSPCFGYDMSGSVVV